MKEVFCWKDLLREDDEESFVFSGQMRKHGFCVIELEESSPEGWNGDWESVFLRAFEQDDVVKKKSGVYRVERGLAVGYRQDESREFFETRLSSSDQDGRKRWSSCEPRYDLDSVARENNGVTVKYQYEATVCGMSNCLGDVGEWCIGSVSRHLQLDREFLVALTDTGSRSREVSSSLMRICYYPAGPHSAATNPLVSNVAFGAHTDTSFLTVSPCSSVPGLEVQDLSTGQWFRPEDVDPDHVDVGGRRRVVVFAGEMLEAVTKHRFRACVHRVLSPPVGVRVSCPFLIRCNSDAIFAPSLSAYHHQGGARAMARLPDLEGMKMGLVQKVLDMKRGRCVRIHQDTQEDWVLRAYTEEEQVVDESDEDEENVVRAGEREGG